MATKPMELMIEQANYHRTETKNGVVNDYVSFRPRIRGDVEAHKEQKNAGFYPAGKPGKSSKTNDREQTMTVDKFNEMMEKSGSELRIEDLKESKQLVGANTPDNERPIMKAALQGYKTEKTVNSKGENRIKKVPTSSPKEVENYKISMKSVEPSEHPDFSKEEHHKGISEVNKARLAEREAQKQKETPAKEAEGVEMGE